MENNKVEWKTIPGFEKYEINTLGQVRRIGKTRIKKSTINHRAGGYEMIQLYGADSTPYNLYVHRLMAEAFLGGFPEGTETRHLDSNPRNNRLDNLAVGTKAENMADRAHNTGRKQPHIPRELIGTIRELWRIGLSAAEIKRTLEIQQGTCAIANAALGRTFENA